MASIHPNMASIHPNMASIHPNMASILPNMASTQSNTASILPHLTWHPSTRTWQVKEELAAMAPYGEWLGKHRTIIEPLAFDSEKEDAQPVDNEVQQMTAFGWSSEDLEMQARDPPLDTRDPA
eukprot:4806053-Prymnesium_polylepis.1